MTFSLKVSDLGLYSTSKNLLPLQPYLLLLPSNSAIQLISKKEQVIGRRKRYSDLDK